MKAHCFVSSRRQLFFAGLGVFGILAATSARADEEKSAGVITGEVVAHSPKLRANVIVNLEKVTGSFRPPARPVEMDQKGMQFVPHAMAILKGTTVRFNNGDAVSHNVFSPDGEKYNLGTWPQGQSKTYTFKNVGLYHQLCNVHPEMGAIIEVFDNPYFAVSGADGKFRIEGVPPGTYSLRAWGEKIPESKRQVTVTAGGTANVRIESGK